MPKSAFPTQLSKETLTIEFQAGQPFGVNGVKYSNPVDAILKVEELAGPFSISRDVYVGDTIIGIKCHCVH